MTINYAWIKLLGMSQLANLNISKKKYPTKAKAVLVLEKGPKFEGYFFGKNIETEGEVVFNTGMVGYPETLTDPSYRGEILVFTQPLIGNYGVPNDDKEFGLLKHFESDNIHIRGLVVSDYSFEYSHWNAIKSLDTWLKEHNIPGIYGVDTRELTKVLRKQGTMSGCIQNEDAKKPKKWENESDKNLVAEVSTNKRIVYKKGPKKVLLVDCGVKNNIIRSFLKRDITVVQVPWDYDFSDEKYDGLFISNGPGDPKQCTETIKHIKVALTKNKPIFGICLGNQLLALAAGADTYKLKYGHRSQNQPCVLAGTKRCFITSQNHGFAVREKTLPKNWESFFINNNDNTNEGIRHKNKPFFSVQFHPEATPGPTDTDFLFDDFVKLLKK